MTTELYCFRCGRRYDGETYVTHRCGITVACAMCGEDVPVRQFKDHRCVGQAMSVHPSSADERRIEGRRYQPPRGRPGVPPLRAVPNSPTKGA